MRNNKFFSGIITVIFSITLIFNINTQTISLNTVLTDNSNDKAIILNTELPFEN